jgi:hypothetical protein
MGVDEDVVELYDTIQALIEEHSLVGDSPAVRVALQVIDGGLGSLSLKEKAIYEALIVPALGRHDINRPASETAT